MKHFTFRKKLLTGAAVLSVVWGVVNPESIGVAIGCLVMLGSAFTLDFATVNLDAE